MKLWTYTLGCKVNQYETELLRHQLLGAMDETASNFKDADLCLINTCTVTASADKESRQWIRKVLRENPKARVVVTGCYATRAPEVIRSISHRIEVFGNHEKFDLPQRLGCPSRANIDHIERFYNHSRAYVKIQDGCSSRCQYCVVPKVRPQLWSKDKQTILTEVQSLIQNGHKEIVLTGIRLGLYQDDSAARTNGDLVGVLEEVVKLKGAFRVRLSSLEITEISQRLLSLMQREPKICRHLHIPLQSGDDSVLKRMGRWYTTTDFSEGVELARKELPDCGITTDVIVGYPGETQDEFNKTVDFIKRMQFSGLHVFRFSPREGTPAYSMPRIDFKTIFERAYLLGQLDEELRRQFLLKFSGTIRSVLVEFDGTGYTDNYIRVYCGTRFAGQLIPVKLQPELMRHPPSKNEFLLSKYKHG